MAKINYQQVGWDTTKYFNPTNMNQMDNGIKAACDKADANEAAIADVNSNLVRMVNWTTSDASKRISLAYDFNTNKIGVWKDGIFIREI